MHSEVSEAIQNRKWGVSPPGRSFPRASPPQEAVVADVAGPNFCFMWGGTFGATSLSFYNTKREEELCPEAAPRPVGSRILPANDRSHTSVPVRLHRFFFEATTDLSGNGFGTCEHGTLY